MCHINNTYAFPPLKLPNDPIKARQLYNFLLFHVTFTCFVIHVFLQWLSVCTSTTLLLDQRVDSCGEDYHPKWYVLYLVLHSMFWSSDADYVLKTWNISESRSLTFIYWTYLTRLAKCTSRNSAGGSQSGGGFYIPDSECAVSNCLCDIAKCKIKTSWRAYCACASIILYYATILCQKSNYWKLINHYHRSVWTIKHVCIL